MLVDFNFIKKLEGNKLKGYVPDFENSNSGVTIACGFDLGQRKRRYIKKQFSKLLAAKLLPYCGVKGLSAKLMTNFIPLEITQQEADEINSAVQASALNKLLLRWRKASDIPFDSLPIEVRTVIVSVAFQYGSLALKAPVFWSQVTNGDWYGALKNLRDFGDRYSSRRNTEADLLESYFIK